MNDNYLWDKSGEPDEEIQQLESLLSEFRYQPRPLVLPEELPKRSIFSAIMPFFTMRYAMAAAMALLALSAGLWLVVQTAPTEQIAVQSPPTPSTPHKDKVATPTGETAAAKARTAPSVKHEVVAKPRVRNHTVRSTSRQLEAEGELAKEKVLLALQLTSRQLDLISKKMQTDTN